MIVKQIISESRGGDRMEVIAKDDDTLKTLHLHREHDVWRYFVGYDEKGEKGFLTYYCLKRGGVN